MELILAAILAASARTQVSEGASLQTVTYFVANYGDDGNTLNRATGNPAID